MAVIESACEVVLHFDENLEPTKKVRLYSQVLKLFGKFIRLPTLSTPIKLLFRFPIFTNTAGTNCLELLTNYKEYSSREFESFKYKFISQVE